MDLNNKKSFEINEGGRKVMFSAPHSVEQLREGKIKSGEPETGIIAAKLSDMGYPSIVKLFNNNDDANYDEVSDYKDDLKKYIDENSIKYLFDLHELSPLRPMEVCIGTGRGKNIFGRQQLVDIVMDNLNKYGISNITVDEPFAACGETTVSACIARECNIPVIQVEMNSRLFMENDGWIETFVNVLDNIAQEYILL